MLSAVVAEAALRFPWMLSTLVEVALGLPMDVVNFLLLRRHLGYLER